MPLDSTPKRICFGFGPYEDKCPNAAGPHSPYWCDRCELLRTAHIDKQFESILANMKAKRERVE